jgi:glycosyltransferase involved in cell wall biosynthesis
VIDEANADRRGERRTPSRRLLIVSSNPTWGGSEELWFAAAMRLAASGHEVTALKPNLDDPHRSAELRRLGVNAFDSNGLLFLPAPLVNRAAAYAPLVGAVTRGARVRRTLRATKPDFALLSQGGNFDGGLELTKLLRHGGRYAILCQQAGELYWPVDRSLPHLRAGFRAARFVAFVSEHNWRLTEEQLGIELPQGLVVRNPFKVPWDGASSWPSEEPLRLACVARLNPPEKGQDILLRVLARPKWRSRALQVSFFGEGEYRRGLEAMASYLRIENVRFCGFSNDVPSIWKDHHALVLPSRCEGLPLAIIEAMLSGRVAIVTPVGGAREVIQDGIDGYLASSPTEDGLDDALERAWSARANWRDMGAKAAENIRKKVPPRPEEQLMSLILANCGGQP